MSSAAWRFQVTKSFGPQYELALHSFLPTPSSVSSILPCLQCQCRRRSSTQRKSFTRILLESWYPEVQTGDRWRRPTHEVCVVGVCSKSEVCVSCIAVRETRCEVPELAIQIRRVSSILMDENAEQTLISSNVPYSILRESSLASSTYDTNEKPNSCQWCTWAKGRRWTRKIDLQPPRS